MFSDFFAFAVIFRIVFLRVPLSGFARWERSLEEDRVNHQGQFAASTTMSAISRTVPGL